MQLVTVVMAAYNAEVHIDVSLSSIISQTYSELDIIVVDDGSTDSTADRIKEFAKMDKRIRFFWQNHSGVSAARNLGIDNANGNWITFLMPMIMLKKITLSGFLTVSDITHANAR